MKRSLLAFAEAIRHQPSRVDLAGYIAANFRVYQSGGSDGEGRMLFTGYYEPLFEGRLQQSGGYSSPVYGWPDDLVSIDLSLFPPEDKGRTLRGRLAGRKITPYYTREQIVYGGAIAGRTPVLAWMKDPVDLFFLEIQGSGRLYIPSYGWMNVHYHTSNGRPYKSIGKLLIDEGRIDREQMSMQRIREYLDKHPNDIQRILSYNESYVFFKTENSGPLGALNVLLTPGRSLALDARAFPKGALAYVETEKPLADGDGRLHQWVPLRRFVLNQDTGGAIKGFGRADLFWGNGPYAELAAGHMKQPGRLYLLVLKPHMSGPIPPAE